MRWSDRAGRFSEPMLFLLGQERADLFVYPLVIGVKLFTPTGVEQGWIDRVQVDRCEGQRLKPQESICLRFAACKLSRTPNRPGR